MLQLLTLVVLYALQFLDKISEPDNLENLALLAGREVAEYAYTVTLVGSFRLVSLSWFESGAGSNRMFTGGLPLCLEIQAKHAERLYIDLVD